MSRRRRISVANLRGGYRVNAPLVRRIAAAALRRSGAQDAGLELVFVDDRSIRALNRRYMKRDRPTDVLSFAFAVAPAGKPAGATALAGAIFISVDRAKAQAKAFGAGFGEEIARYVIHGILHLFGYDDLTRRDRERMFAKEDEILRWLATKEDLSKVLTPR